MTENNCKTTVIPTDCGTVLAFLDQPRERVDYVMERFDNYYDANGLLMFNVSEIKGKYTGFYVQLVWNAAYSMPADAEFEGNIARWQAEYDMAKVCEGV